MKKILIITLLVFVTNLFSQIVNIPDVNFKSALIELGVDANNDGKIQVTEANNFDNDFGQLNATYVYVDLTGLEEFHNITVLEIDNSLVSEIHLSPIANFEVITFTNSLITTIDLSDVNFPFDLDLSNNPNLTYINLKNGENTEIGGVSVQNTPNLNAVCVDDINFMPLINEIEESTGHTVNFNENCSILGINNETLITAMNLHPNPTFGLVQIESEFIIKQITIFNYIGKQVYSENNTNIFNITTFTKGVYFVQIEDENGNLFQQKIIKK